jgi:parvulin-like peptidyl-prolyl isomerase
MRSKPSLIILPVLLLAACGAAPQATIPATALPVPEQVTPTVEAPLAKVNGEPVSAESFSINLAQYRAAQAQTGTLLASDNVEQIVLEDLISRLLLAQGAREQGFVLDEAAIDQRLAAVIEQAGGQETFDAWLAQQGYTAESFRRELTLEIEAGWMRAEITEAAPLNAEQVLARQILLTDRFQAERLLGQLDGGTPFEQVARNNDAQGLGYLGWFPRGYLLQPAVEEAAFALQPGEYSGIVETSLGFHLIEVLDRDPGRPLNPQARLSLQQQALADWLTAHRVESTIEILLP